jgi:predicted NAD/FAD-binding protein
MTSPDTTARPLRVGVVGTGIAGLSCTFVLKSPKTNPDPERFHVSILERLDGIGMDAHSIDIDPETGKHATNLETKIRLNTPPRSLSKGYYTNLVELYRLGEVRCIESCLVCASTRPPICPSVRQSSQYNR